MLVLGIVLFALGLLFSIAWHELGHYTAARRFGIRVPEFMVGFGPTVLSVKKGETEFGLKAVPLGGYIRMIGMIPPARPASASAAAAGRGRSRGWSTTSAPTRSATFEPGDERPPVLPASPWQRIIVMFAGPFMNLILAVVLFAIVLMGFGVATTPQPRGRTPVERVRRPGLGADRSRLPAGRPADARRAGGLPARRPHRELRRPDLPETGRACSAPSATRAAPCPSVVERNGAELTLTRRRSRTSVPDLDTPLGADPRYITASFLGLEPDPAA